MAEFRKREDITQEIDILQTWSEMGAPRMGDLEQNLQSLMKSVDPGLMRPGEKPARPTLPPPPKPRDVSLDVRPAEPVEEKSLFPPIEIDENEPPVLPPPPSSPFADLPPGDDEDKPAGSFGPLLVTGVLVLAAIGAVLSRWEPFNLATRPAPRATGSAEPAHAASPEHALVPASAGPAHASPEATAVPSHAAAFPAHPEKGMGPSHAAGQAPHQAPGSPGPTHVAAVPAHPHVNAGAPRSAPTRTARAPKPIVREYRVQAGDSLSAIARDQLGDMGRWHELYAANQDQVADPNLITPGETLKLPTTPQVTVKPGDTLERLAAAHLGSAKRWREIYELNRGVLKSPTIVPPGTVLKLPESAGPAAGTERRPGLAGRAASHHMVRHGDSLSLLAQRYLGSAKRWPEIYYLNSHLIANPHWIFPGQVLAIPAAHRPTRLRYVVRSGDTLWAIAGSQLGQPLRWTAIYHANKAQIRDPHWIYPGQAFQLP